MLVQLTIPSKLLIPEEKINKRNLAVPQEPYKSLGKKCLRVACNTAKPYALELLFQTGCGNTVQNREIHN